MARVRLTCACSAAAEQETMERSPLLRVREFVMRNEGTEDHLKQCTALLVSEIDAGRAGLVRSNHAPAASHERPRADPAAVHRAPRFACVHRACGGGAAALRGCFRVCALCASLRRATGGVADRGAPPAERR